MEIKSTFLMVRYITRCLLAYRQYSPQEDSRKKMRSDDQTTAAAAAKQVPIATQSVGHAKAQKKSS